MSVKVTVKQLQEHLPEILNRAVADDDVCLIERNGESVAVIVSLREWQRHSISERLDARGPEYRLGADRQLRAEELLAQECLTKLQEKELAALLEEAEAIMLRRAEALEHL